MSDVRYDHRHISTISKIRRAWALPGLGHAVTSISHQVTCISILRHRGFVGSYQDISRPFSSLPQSIPSERKNLNTEQSVVFMSSTTQTTSSTSNFQLITDALADYTKITGIDLPNNPEFAIMIEHSNSPEAILQLLQERERAFKEYRDGDRRLISCLSLVVNVLQAFSGILGDAVSLSVTYHRATF